MVDPRPILDAVRPGDKVLTKASGAVNDSGIMCFGPNGKLCMQDKNGLRETVAAAGHGVDFPNYQPFEGKRVARSINNAPRLGEELMELNVFQLDRLRSPTDTLFAVDSPANPEHLLRFATVSESALRKALLVPDTIIWPQALDGAEKGTAIFTSP